MSYKDDVPQTEGLGRFGGVYITKPGVPHVIERLGAEKGRTLFRILPEMQNGQPMPWRMDASPFAFSYWMYAEKVIRMCGVNDKFTCFTRVAGKDRNFAGPIDRFVKALYDIFKNTPGSVPPEWLKWKEKQGSLPKVEMGGLLQGLMIENRGKCFRNKVTGQMEPIHPVLLMLTRSAREGIEKIANTEVAGYNGPPDDYNSRFLCGDITGGRIVQIVFVPQEGVSFAHYQVNVLGAMNGQPAPMMPIPPVINAEWKPWDQILRYLSVEEQLGLLVQHFPPEAVDCVFGESDLIDILPSAVRGKWAAYQRSRAAGFSAPPSGYGAPPPAGYAPAYPQQAYGQQAPAPAAPQWAGAVTPPNFGAPPAQQYAPAPAPAAFTPPFSAPQAPAAPMFAPQAPPPGMVPPAVPPAGTVPSYPATPAPAYPAAPPPSTPYPQQYPAAPAPQPSQGAPTSQLQVPNLDLGGPTNYSFGGYVDGSKLPGGPVLDDSNVPFDMAAAGPATGNMGPATVAPSAAVPFNGPAVPMMPTNPIAPGFDPMGMDERTKQAEAKLAAAQAARAAATAK